MIARLACLFFVCLVVSGCANNPTALRLTTEAVAAEQIETIFATTTRQPDPDPALMFSGERSDRLSYASVDVTIPEIREQGKVVKPSAVPDITRQFAATSRRGYESDDAFIAAVNAQLARKPKEDRRIFLFTHGYNVTFAEGIYRHAQMTRDFGSAGVPVHYSWPSAGKLALYIYDRDSMTFARGGLIETLDLLTKTDAREIAIVGHSMGTQLVVEALLHARLTGKDHIFRKLEVVVLASPDIDVDVFREQIKDLKPLPQPFVIFVDSHDRALSASRQIRGGHARVGEGRNIEELRELGIVVLDLSNVEDSGDRLRHSTFATSPTVISMVESGQLKRATLGDGRPAQGVDDVIVGGTNAVSEAAAAVIYLPRRILGGGD